MRKRGIVVAFGVILVLLSSAFAIITSSQPAAATPCCITDSDCGPDESCDWPGGWNCLLLGKCNKLWPYSCGQLGYANDCSSDSECGTGKYCSTGTKTAYVAVHHQCEYISANECKSCSYPSADCNKNGGCETNLNTDTNNCGSCGNKCASGGSCESGTCKAPPPKCFDTDKDGYDGKTSDCSTGSDCNDANANINPGKIDTQCDGIDNDCSGGDYCPCNNPSYADADGDGYKDPICGGNDCNDYNAAINPGATDICENGIDENCFYGDATCPCSDADGDGYGNPGKTNCAKSAETDCNNNNANIYPGATEICGNGVDEDCSGADQPCSCGNNVLDSGEACDNDPSSSTRTKSQSCPGGYPSVTATCNSGCTGYDYTCGSCGDGVKNGDETGVDCGGACTTTAAEVCGDGKDNNHNCQIDEGCAVVVPASCGGVATEDVCNADESGYYNRVVADSSCPKTECSVATATCPNGKVDAGETCASCPQDVKCQSGQYCNSATASCQITPPPPPPPTCDAIACAQAGGTCVGNNCITTPCSLTEPGKSKACCEGKGHKWLKSGEHDAGDAGTGTKEGSLPVCSASDWKSSTVSSVSKMLGSDAKKAQLAVDGSKAYYAWEVSNQIVVVSANIDGSGAVKTTLSSTCPTSNKACGQGISGFKMRAYSGKLYFAWKGETSSNIYAAYVDVNSLKGGSKAVSASAVLPSGASKYMEQFDFAVGNEGPDYVYLEGGPCTSYSDGEGGYSDDCNYAQGGVFLAKPGGVWSKIASWSKTGVGDNFASYWGGPLIAKDGGFTYYVWGDVTTEKYYYSWGLGFVAVYGVNVAVKGSSGLNKYEVYLTKDVNGPGQAGKSGLDAVAVGGKAYISYRATPAYPGAPYNTLLSFDAATQMEDLQLQKGSPSGYSAPLRLARAGNLVYAVWSEGFDSIWLTYGSSKDEFVKNVKGITPFDTSDEDYHAQAMLHTLGVAGSSGYVSYIDSLQVFNGVTGYAQVSCTGAGTGAAAGKASKTKSDGQFKDNKGERKAPDDVKLDPDQESCTDNFWVARSMECGSGVCASNPADAALCDKPSDCVYNGKCYSDIITVAATFFGNDQTAAWNSAAWQKEVAVDVNGDGKLEVCDPGQWQNPVGTVAGTVTDITSGAPIGTATVNMAGTSNPAKTYSATTAADGTYTISNVDAGTYDMTASKAGYGNQVKANQPIQPFQVNTINFQLTPSGGGGVWGGGVGTISGTVRNITSQPVAGATVKVLGTSFKATTDAGGSYSMPNVPSGTYDISSSKPSDGYDDATALNVDIVSGPITVDFTMLHGLGGCTNDCTKAGSNICDASCDGKGSCKFYSDETKQACDGTFGIISLPGGKQVTCCGGQPYTPQKADVTVPAKQVIKTIKPVLYQGKLVKLVTLLFIPEKSG